MSRVDGRAPDELRPISISPNFLAIPEGSALISLGETSVLCTVTIEERVPRWLESRGSNQGWVTAEYAMLPRSTHQRTPRETSGLRGRTQEIRRLIGRSLRMAVNLNALGPRTCIVDCDVLQAAGGTRTASITGGYVALRIALMSLIREGAVPPAVLRAPVAAVSVGILSGVPVLDLSYAEDIEADSDVNVVMNADGQFIEVQGSAEGAPFSRGQLDALLDLADIGVRKLLSAQRAAYESSG